MSGAKSLLVGLKPTVSLRNPENLHLVPPILRKSLEQGLLQQISIAITTRFVVIIHIETGVRNSPIQYPFKHTSIPVFS